MNNHKKTKHPDLFKDMPQRGRGRPRKYPPKNAGDFESTKYDIFFTMNQRGPEEGKSIDINSVIQNVFSFIYQSQNSDKLFSKPKTYKENPILNNLANEKKMRKLVMKFFMNIYILLRINAIKNFYHF